MSKSKHKRISKFTHVSLNNMTTDQQAAFFRKHIKQNIINVPCGLLMGNFEGLRQYTEASTSGLTIELLQAAGGEHA